MTKTFTEDYFSFKQFRLRHDRSAMKVGTDAVLLGAWVPVKNGARILDVGTGCGVIALMLAQRTSESIITGVEIDSETCEDALFNVGQSPWKDRVEIIQNAVQEYAKGVEQTFDEIVSNPPFFSGGTFSESQAKVAVRHTTKLSHGDLLRAVGTLLNKEGTFSVILPHIEGLRFIEIAETYRLYLSNKVEVYTKKGEIVRLLMQFKKKRVNFISNILHIYNPDNQLYSPEYIQLTREFYLYMP
jgi:tRNA1Val (adenine37-N6)-methyltransferase